MRLERAPVRRSRIALTSLVDVVFILLFFFMLAARPPAPRVLEIAVTSPAAASPAATDPAVDAELLGADRIHYRDRIVSTSQLVTALNAGTPGARLRLKTGAGASLQDLVAAMDVLRDAGVSLDLVGGG